MDDRAQKLAAWAQDLGKKRVGSIHDITFDESAAQMRDLLARGLVKMTDLRDDPAWFFEVTPWLPTLTKPVSSTPRVGPPGHRN